MAKKCNNAPCSASFCFATSCSEVDQPVLSPLSSQASELVGLWLMSPAAVQRALMLSNDIFFKDHVVVVGTLLAGIGPTCRGYPWCRPQ